MHGPAPVRSSAFRRSSRSSRPPEGGTTNPSGARMKRAGNLFDAIADRDTLRQAVVRALRGKRDRAEARAFVADLDRNLDALAAGLRAGTYPLGRCRQF